MGRKKRKADDEPSPPAADSRFRPWPDLPQDILLSVRDRVSISIPDLVAFSSVCRSWRSAASASAAPFAGPPLLLVPSATSSDGLYLRWSGPPQCRLKALTATTRSYRSAISSKTLKKKKCVGCSYGHLIFVGYKKCLLADVFTGREVHPPDFTAGHRGPVSGILTAPLSSASCLLLLFSLDPAAHDIILCWKPGTDYWSKLGPNDGVPVGITIIGVFKDRILVMDWHYNLIELDFFPRPSSRYVQATKPGGFPGLYERYLVECGEELLCVRIAPGRSSEVYRLDWSGSVWVKMDGLGDWCLFIDDRWKFAVACHDPRRWGGRENCIYFTLWGADTWVVVPLGSMVTYEWHTRGPWPAPFWVYPSKLL